MKKLALSLVVGAALALTPISSFALTAMSDANMKDATGQAGVSIVVDDITLYQAVGETMYIDTDGIAKADTDAAAIVMSGVETNTTIRALLDYTDRNGFLKTAFDGTTVTEGALSVTADGYNQILQGVRGNRAAANTTLGVELHKNIEIAAISIDVASKAPVLTALNANGDGSDVTAVVIGLPTIEICKTGDTQQVGIVACDADNGDYTSGDLKHFIQIEKSDSVMTVLGGTLEIAAH